MRDGNTRHQKNGSPINFNRKLLAQVCSCSTLPAVFAGLTLTTGAMAQQSAFDDAPALEEIIVTARYREESLQDVPLAITAFDKDTLEAKNIVELEDVARFTSGFSFEDFSGGFSSPVIRGQAQTRVTALESNVSTFFDGIYVPRSWAVDIGTSNLERVEVVKGPQSARYGRNAFSGAVNYVPIKADTSAEQTTGDISVTVGSDERLDVGAVVQIPVNDRFAIAGSFNTSEYDGSFENAHPFAGIDLGRGTTDNVGGWDNTSYSLSLQANPTDRLALELGYYNYELENEARASQWFSSTIPGTANCGTVRFGQPSLICGELPDAPEETIVDPRGFGVFSDTELFRAEVAFDITQSLTVSYLFGGIDGDVDIGTSGEPDPINCGTLVGPPFFASLCNFQNAPIGEIDYESHEVRFGFANDGAFAFNAGVFLSDGQDDFRFNSINIAPITDANNVPPLIGTPVPSFSMNPGPFNIPLTNESTDTDVLSIFGEVQWRSADERTRVGVEVRYSDTEVTTNNNASGTRQVGEFDVVTPRLTLERDLNENSLIYGSIARGAKTGGFNPTAIAPENRVFDEEFNWTYEVGSKNVFMDGRLTLNGTLFYSDWTDIQINSSDPDADNPNAVNITLNLGDADMLGLEMDAAWLLTDNVTVDATFSHVEAEYKNGTVDGRLLRVNPLGQPPCDDIVCNSDGQIGGNEVERSPQTQFSVGLQLDGELSGWAQSYYLRTDLSWQSDFYATPANLAEIPSRTLLGLRGGISITDNIDVSLWARNLTDENYVSNAFVVLLPFGNTYGNFFGERRSYGLTARWSF